MTVASVEPQLDRMMAKLHLIGDEDGIRNATTPIHNNKRQRQTPPTPSSDPPINPFERAYMGPPPKPLHMHNPLSNRPRMQQSLESERSPSRASTTSLSIPAPAPGDIDQANLVVLGVKVTFMADTVEQYVIDLEVLHAVSV